MFIQILFGLTLFALVLCFYFLFRNNKVCDFRIAIVNADSKAIGSEYIGHFYAYESLPSYDRMLHMFWVPLELEFWLSNENVNRIKPYFRNKKAPSKP